MRVKESERPVLVQSVGTAFSVPRPFGEPQATPPLFLVIIVRDLQAFELEAVAPAGLFAVSPWVGPMASSCVDTMPSVMAASI